ncbi:hypothetical protein L0U85_03845 [Glycomyces sp. L485]|uniref:hypothetical protein n=1 Tax=Glycomyces sp. L485 TaxID=2909235 RepID=UPI001F4AB0A1|nr:hypothetical protein [Glycomyces sp. L485]MCH7229995.1 hypothetical protein [Glycomyces sp. L485]
MSTIHQLGAGTLRVLTVPDPIADPPTVALDHPLTGYRVTLHGVPDGMRALLIAVITGSGTEIPVSPHFANNAATGFTIGVGLLRTNRPAPRLGPVDRIGLDPEPGQTAWRDRVLDRLDGRLIQLEAHPPGCSCGRSVPIPRQRDAAETGAMR